jgi:hypothetical protein
VATAAEKRLRVFDHFDRHLAAKGYMARSEQMVDATIVAGSYAAQQS